RVSHQAQAVGTVRVRVARALPDRPDHRLPAGLLVLPLAPELRPRRGSRRRVHRPAELHGGADARPALPRVDLEHGGDHRPGAGLRAAAGARDRAPAEPGDSRPAVPAMVSPVMAAMAWRMMFGVKFGAI